MKWYEIAAIIGGFLVIFGGCTIIGMMASEIPNPSGISGWNDPIGNWFADNTWTILFLPIGFVMSIVGLSADRAAQNAKLREALMGYSRENQK